MDKAQLQKAYRNAWILLLLIAAFVVAFFVFTLRINEDHPPVEWDMGGVEFVPASSVYANGYHAPVNEPAEQPVEQPAKEAPFETE